MALLKVSTSYNRMILMVDKTDHITGKASETLTVNYSQNGGAFTSASAPTVTDRGSGWYNLALTSTHTAAIGDLAFHITSTNTDPTDFVDQVIDGIPVDVQKISGSNVSTSTAQLGVNVVNIAGTASAGAAGYVGLDWGHITAPTTTQNLSGTTISAVSGAVGSVTGNVGGSVGSVTGAVGSVTGTVDIGKINGDATAAANLSKTTGAICRGTSAGTSSTVLINTSAFTPSGAATDQFKGRVITFDANTTTASLRGQSTLISGNTNAALPALTVVALTTAPALGDTFSVT